MEAHPRDKHYVIWVIKSFLVHRVLRCPHVMAGNRTRTRT